MASNTYDAIGNAVDISDIITDISPDDTPLFRMIGKTKATATKHEWLEDSLGDPVSNAYPEGFTYFTDNAAPRVRLDNYTQIMSRGIQVTRTQESVLKYGGILSEMGYQMKKVMKELAFDCEKALIEQAIKDPGSMAGASSPPVWQGNTPNPPAAATAPRLFGGLPYWIITHTYQHPTAPGTARPLTFDLINNALEDTWNDGGKPSILLVSPRNKRVISTFTAGNTKYMEGNKEHKLSQYIDVLETDFGVLRVHTDRYMPNDKVYGLSPEYMKKAFLDNFKVIDLPRMADAYQKSVTGEWTLEMRAEKAHFVIQDLDGIMPVSA